MNFDFAAEQISLRNSISKFAHRELNENLGMRERNGEFSWEGWKKCAELGIQGLPLPGEYGGSGVDMLTTIYAMEGLGFGCRDNGLVHSINSHMWGCEIPILKFGTNDQKQSYLPFLCKGKVVGAHALTEPDVGSDVFSIKTSAVKNGRSYVLNGSKSIVSNAPFADIIIVFAVTNPNRKILGGISAFIVEKNVPGLKMGQPFEKMGLKTSPIAELFFDACRVPAENLLGGEGAAIAVFNETMEWERSCLSACHIGAMERILNLCVQYARERTQFGQPIGKFQSVSNKVAEMKKNLELGKLMLYKIGWLKSQQKNVLAETAIAKLFISESFKAASLDAIQIHGALGYMSESGIEKELRDSVASTIYSGTSEIQRNIISRCLGL